MNKMLNIGLIVCLLLISVDLAAAHPGRTDANGGHTCRTNCEKWGLQYGEYHYHNGGKASSNGGTTTPKKQQVVPVKQQAPVVQKKTIVAIDQANVLEHPNNLQVVTTLWYGYEVKDQGSLFEGFILLDQGYLSTSVLTNYDVIKSKGLKVAAEKAYFFPVPNATSKARGSASKHAVVNVVGERDGFYYGSTKDANGKTLVGFVSKTVVK